MATRALAATDVVISEFLASNSRIYPDENGQFADWIELHNTTFSNINVGGWYLTDSSGNLTKWRIPATNIVAGGYLVVFADGLNKAVAGAPLHTSFNLSADGEYLALVRPDHSIATEFAPKFPVQVPNVSYGIGRFATNSTLVTTNSLVRVRIPANGNDGLAWTMTGFDDGSWTVGTNAVGYAPTNVALADYSTVVLPMQPVAYYRLNESSGTVAANIGSLGGNGGYTAATLGTPGPQPPTFPGFEANNNAPTFNGTSAYATASNSLLSGKQTFSMSGWINVGANPVARTGLFGQNDALEFGFSAVGNLQAWTPNGNANLSWSPPLNVWFHIAVTCDGANLRIYTNGVLGATAACTGTGSSGDFFNIGGGGILDTISVNGNWFNGKIDEVAVFYRTLSAAEVTALYQGGLTPSALPLASMIKTDVNAAMSNVNASAYIRIPFVVPDTNNVAQMTLRARYNDGFVAYINGNEVARANAVDPLAFNSAAITNHSANSFVDYRFAANMLANGSNILAIQGLNASASDSDFFISTELIGISPAVESSVPLYFTTPSPGADNNGGIANPGPLITDVSHTPNVPRDDQDITVTARITRSFNDVNQVFVRYRVMFGTELEIQMLDDGLHGDGAAGDGVFGATLPISSVSTNGEMVRWYFRATDNQGNVSRWPLFSNPADSEEYLGTMVDVPGLTSKLPVVHLFAPTTVLQPGPTTSQTGADSQTGGRVAVFFDGEFYDNVEFNLRGNSTSGFNKKAHHVNFNSEHPFRPPYGRERLRHTSFEADYPDPTYMRQALSFWLTEQMGIPSAYYDPVRLQLNTKFYQLASHNNVVGAEQLAWMGLDPNGALYKAAGQILTSHASTGNFEKKTRLWENTADFDALASGIVETLPVGQRRTNVFDMIDVPAVLNYLVSARWVHENDDVWANMTVYRDTLGDKLWHIIPFDMNLSWGAIFYEGGAACQAYVEGVQATNDVHKGHPLYGSGSCLPCGSANYNRMYDVFFQVPELRQMFLRRMRTLLDTVIKPPGTPTNSTFLEQMIVARRDLIADEANRDRAWWGWPAKGGQCNFDPGINITNGVSGLLNQFILARRQHFYGKHSVTNSALPIGVANVNNAGIPLAQPTNAVIQIASFEYNPSSGNQGQEYIAITNPNPYSLDISGWKLDGAVNFTFHPGTVMLSNSVLYVTPDLNAFRSRTTAPKSGQGLFVVGPYKGQLSARGETIVVKDNVDRVVSTNSYIGNPSPAQQYLRITEIMYHPASTNGGLATYPQEDYEYIELKNIGPVALNLVGVHFTNGFDFAFTTNSAVTNLAAGQSVVLVHNPAAFVARYGSSATIAGVYTGFLDNSGERIQLHDAVGEQILDFSYNNAWYPITDGLGFSLVIVDDTAPFDTWDKKASWRPSGQVGGSPGGTDPQPVVVPGVLVNEVLANSLSPQVDTIELWNPTTNTASIGGWYLSDDFVNPKKYRIPAGRSIAPGGYAVFTENDFNVTNPPSPTGFAFSSSGDEAYLFAADAAGNLLGYYHGFHFGGSDEGVSFGRYITSDGAENFVAQKSQTFGATNSGPAVGPIVISEIMYHPPDIGGNDDQIAEFIELRNLSSNTVALYDPLAITNTWKLKDAVDFDFPTNATVPAGGYLLVVSFDPQTNAAALATFRTTYGLDPSVPIVGPYKGKLDNSSAHVELSHPQPFTTNGVDYVLSDKVDYKDSAPWSSAADGFGPSLHRIVPGDFGNDVTNWIAAAPSPAAPRAVGAAPVITTQPLPNVSMLAGQSTNLSVTASGTGLHYQWRLNGTNIDNATNAVLNLVNALTSQAGPYQVLVYNGGGTVLSSNSQVAVFTPVFITQQPFSQTGPAGTNVSFTVGAIGNGSLHYQWRFNGAIIPNATNATLAVTNAQLYANAGFYDATVTDDLGSIQSAAATLTILVKPVITNAPTAVTVVQGQNATFQVIAGPDHPLLPIAYKWLVLGGALGSWTNTSNSVFIIFNAQTNGSVRLGVSNPAGQTNITTGLTLTVLPDRDHDGLPDAYETANGFNPDDPADGARDDDGDGMSNRDEYLAGTNPRDASSVLRLTVTSTNSSILGFIGQSNISYTIQTRTNLDAAPWQTWSNINAQGSVRTIQFAPPRSDIRYYRVVTPKSLE